jgi:hypothetical protein
MITAGEGQELLALVRLVRADFPIPGAPLERIEELVAKVAYDARVYELSAQLGMLCEGLEPDTVDPDRMAAIRGLADQLAALDGKRP